MTPRQFSLVKYDYDSLPEEWKHQNPNPYENQDFCYLGKVPNMPGHSVVLTMCHDNTKLIDNRPHVFHTENLIELTENET